MSAKLQSFLKENFRLNAQELSVELLKYCTKRIARRNELLCLPGESKEFFFFVNSGCLRKYFIASNGVECTRSIAFENECIINHKVEDDPKLRRIAKNVFPELSSSKIYIQALERSELTVINTKYRGLLYSNMLDFFCLVHSLLKDEQDIVSWILHSNVKEKYEWLLKCRPQIIQRVPDKIIASYLSISPSTLSRARANRNNYDNGPCH
jgi:hypothetical protein